MLFHFVTDLIGHPHLLRTTNAIHIAFVYFFFSDFYYANFHSHNKNFFFFVLSFFFYWISCCCWFFVLSKWADGLSQEQCYCTAFTKDVWMKEAKKQPHYDTLCLMWNFPIRISEWPVSLKFCTFRIIHRKFDRSNHWRKPLSDLIWLFYLIETHSWFVAQSWTMNNCCIFSVSLIQLNNKIDNHWFFSHFEGYISHKM